MKKNLKLTAFAAILLIIAGGLFSCNKKEPPLEPPFLIVDQTPIIATAEPGTYHIIVSSNGAWTAIVENAGWCTLDNNTGNGDGTITVNVAENPLCTKRNATIKITSGNLTKSVAVLQPIKKMDCREIDCWDFPINFRQIPDSILPYLSTECLVFVCSQNNRLMDLLFFYRDWNRVGKNVFYEFNGNVELLKKDGALIELLKFYDCEIQSFMQAYVMHGAEIAALEFLISFLSREVETTREYHINILRSLVIGYEVLGRGNIANYYARAHAILKIGSKGLDGTLLQDFQVLPNDIENNRHAMQYRNEINRLSYELIK